MCENFGQLHEVRKEAEMPGVGVAGNVFPGITGHYCGSGVARAWETGAVKGCCQILSGLQT